MWELCTAMYMDEYAASCVTFMLMVGANSIEARRSQLASLSVAQRRSRPTRHEPNPNISDTRTPATPDQQKTLTRPTALTTSSLTFTAAKVAAIVSPARAAPKAVGRAAGQAAARG